MTADPAGALRGLPAPLPPGERVLWQGSPRWGALARRVFHLRKLALYCAVLALWRVASELAGGAAPAAAARSVLALAPFAALALGLPALLAWLYSRSTVYTVTDRRVLMRYGVALPMTLNIPHRVVAGAALKRHADGTGDLPLALAGESRIGWLHLWPNARPWRLARPEPMLRGVPEPERVAAILARALTAAAAPAAKAAPGEVPAAA